MWTQFLAAMPPTRARLVRRTPFISRLKAYLNPWDFLLWASEELNGNDWDDFYRQWATPIGILFNVVFMAARANSSGTKRGRGDDVFGDFHERSGSGWLIWFVGLNGLTRNSAHISFSSSTSLP